MDDKIPLIKKYIPYAAIFCLVLVIFLGVYVRTSNIENLKDITTGNYTLGPDLDPFLFLRDAQNIANGTLQPIDMMRRAPLGIASYASQALMPWVIVGVYEIIKIFSTGPIATVEYAAIITPVILFAITLIFFFLFMQKILSYVIKKEYSYIAAVVATLLYSVIPEMLHRTTAGIPELESLGMPFFWMAFYFLIIAWNSETIKKSMIFGLLAGISTSLMIFAWGGYRYIFMTFGLALLIAFLFQRLSKKNIIAFLAFWIVPVITVLIRDKSLSFILSSTSDFVFSGIILFIVLFDQILYKFIIKEKHERIKIPRPFFSLIIAAAVLLLAGLIIIGPASIWSKTTSIFGQIVHPFGEGRVGLTVAENRAPYFTEVLGSFTTTFLGLNISLFWLFLFGTFLLFYEAVKHFKGKNKFILISCFTLYLIMSIFSRYSSTSLFNGENFLSQLIYFLGFIILGFGLFYVFFKGGEEAKEGFKKINFSYLVLISFIFFTIISMRGAVRLFFIIAPPMTIATGFLIVKLFQYGYESNDSFKKIIYLTLVLICAVAITVLIINYGKSSYYETQYTVPGPYQQQWQYAMSWVRESTPENSVFIHWWDYGYWIQTIGGRPTVTDGGHATNFWDHTTARYLMTAENEKTALQLCKAYNVSYFLLDSTDIGKYGAYSSIGSDKTGNDRATWIPTFSLDDKQTQELKNETILVYTGGFYLDQDLTWNNDLLPQGAAGIPAFLVHTQNNAVRSVEAVIIYNNKRYDVPVNYVYMNNKKIALANNGLNAILYFVPKLNSDNTINPVGSSLFISQKVSNGEFARVYLLNETNMTLVHQEDAGIVKQIKAFYNSSAASDFLVANDFYGPIKIFKVPNLENIPYYPEYLQTSWDESTDPGKLDYLGK